MKRTAECERKRRRERERDETESEREKEKKRPIRTRDELEMTSSARTPLTDYFLQSKAIRMTNCVV
ncbi:hypothetical protein T4A_6512 [Trichinella pseudospiralis]|uniref:Uncharacterized protein n=1 Tax=Trichinella pseudospiralis TaxID=6337 RepID=A0A0V1E4N9_TRIPS|nr:hypothetical protein T4A_6512 [Trichinella pseudospiralis]